MDIRFYIEHCRLSLFLCIYYDEKEKALHLFKNTFMKNAEKKFKSEIKKQRESGGWNVYRAVAYRCTAAYAAPAARALPPRSNLYMVIGGWWWCRPFWRASIRRWTVLAMHMQQVMRIDYTSA